MSNLKLVSMSLAAIVALSLTGCGGSGSSSSSSTNDSGSSSSSVCDSSITELPSEITSDKTLTKDKVWGLPGKVNVKSGATLTIEPGTKIAGCIPKSYLVIEPGAKIDANGTQSEPIVFTSQKDVLGQSAPNRAGEWGGLVIAGNAYTHYSNNKYEADESVSFGSTNHSHDNESSGVLNYVVIKHSGYEVEKDKELNGLSLAGVGSGTVIKNIAIIGGLDDGVEIWGGTVNIDGLYVYNAADDSVDTDLGYRGTIKNVLVKQVNVDKTNNHDSAAMEFGNDHDTITTDDTNATQPTIINFTAYVKGGGFYNKYDAGFRWDNVKFISDKTSDYELVHFRGEDSYNTGAKHIDGNVCFYDSNVVLDDNKTYSHKNSKDTTNKTAYAYFVADNKIDINGGSLNYNDQTTCSGANEASIWKGKAGSNDPLEQ